MFSSCFIFSDNTETLSFRLWFPTMPLLVLWPNIDCSVGAEAVSNLSSCPQPPCKTVALVRSWTAVPGVASCPCAAWRSSEGSTSSCVNLHSSEAAVQVLSLKRKRRRHAHLLEQCMRQKSKSIQREILQYIYKPAMVPNSCMNCKAHQLLQLVCRGMGEVSIQYRPLLTPKHPTHCQCNSPIIDHSWKPLLASLKTPWCFNAIQVMLQQTT